MHRPARAVVPAAVLALALAGCGSAGDATETVSKESARVAASPLADVAGEPADTAAGPTPATDRSDDGYGDSSHDDEPAPGTSSDSGPTGGDDAAAGAAPAAQSAPAPAPSADAEPAAADNTELRERASALAAAVTAADHGAVWDLACPGLRGGDSRADYAESLAGSPRVGLTLADVTIGATDAAADAELAAPGGDADDTALVTFDVVPGSEHPNPTLVARFVHGDAGWQYCGSSPDA